MVRTYGKGSLFIALLLGSKERKEGGNGWSNNPFKNPALSQSSNFLPLNSISIGSTPLPQ
jgi:hypothetical protein